METVPDVLDVRLVQGDSDALRDGSWMIRTSTSDSSAVLGAQRPP